MTLLQPAKPFLFPGRDVRRSAIEHFHAFESTLMTITRRSFENMDELDDILQRANSS